MEAEAYNFIFSICTIIIVKVATDSKRNIHSQYELSFFAKSVLLRATIALPYCSHLFHDWRSDILSLQGHSDRGVLSEPLPTAGGDEYLVFQFASSLLPLLRWEVNPEPRAPHCIFLCLTLPCWVFSPNVSGVPRRGR